MKLRDQLQQAYQERDEARTEVQRLCETLEAAAAAKVTLWYFFFIGYHDIVFTIFIIEAQRFFTITFVFISKYVMLCFT